MLKMVFAALAALMTLAPVAGATGYLVNVETPFFSWSHGTNPLGGRGDTVDIGLLNHQCTDEEDVVDVGVLNAEGDSSCADAWDQEGPRCRSDGEKDDVLHGLPALFKPEEPTDDTGRCTDDGDAVDVGVLNREGASRDGQACSDAREWAWGGDRRDGVDVGALNRECRDERDADDVGVLNCERLDTEDGIDVGVLNTEEGDAGDTLDLSILNAESGDGPDANDLNVKRGPGVNLRCALGLV